MTHDAIEPEAPRPPEVETDERFPSGPWKGFFLQSPFAGRQWMELHLTFRQGVMTGEGRDWVGPFVMRGRYETESGKCWWSKRYLGRHDVAYQGYNEGKGIWGVWEITVPPLHGGFHIWPVAMGDPTQARLAAEAEVPVAAPGVQVEVGELATAPA
jgi:hypothetical protein